MSETWHVTVGVQYTPRDTHHPASPRIHADGYLDVTADSYEAARSLVVEALGDQWSFLYAPNHDMTRHPLGCVGIIGLCAGCEQACVLSDGLCDWCRAWPLSTQQLDRPAALRQSIEAARAAAGAS